MANIDKENSAVLAERGEKKHHTSIRTARIVSNTVIYVLLTLMVIIWLTPIAWIVFQSFNSEIGSAGLTRLIPKEWGFDNFYDLFWNVYRDARVDGVAVLPDAPDELLGEVAEVLFRRRVLDGLEFPEFGDSRVDAVGRRVGVGQKEHLKRPLAGLAASCHFSAPPRS